MYFRSTSARSSLREHQRPWPNVPTHQIMPTSVALPPLVSPPIQPSVHQNFQNVHQQPVQVQNHVQELTHQVSNVTLNSASSPPANQQQRPARRPVASPETNTSASNNLDVGVVPTLKYNQGNEFIFKVSSPDGPGDDLK